MTENCAILYCNNSYPEYKRQLALFAEFSLEAKREHIRKAIMDSPILRTNFIRACAREFEKFCQGAMYFKRAQVEVNKLMWELDSVCRRTNLTKKRRVG